MSVLVFTGPTLPPGEARPLLDVEYAPPAGHGDVLRAVQRARPPRAIAVIDGVFGRVAAVRHKEILWAMAAGIHVFGAASMGALRAAELDRFGMVGVGAVYAALRDGTLEDDDEVAVLHGPAELGYPALGEAMVDIRATLEAAAAAGVVEPAAAAALAALAKAMHFRERSYPALLAAGAAAGLERAALDRLAGWLPTGRRRLKREDAVALLAALAAFLVADPPAKEVAFRFEATDAWEQDVAAAAAAAAGGAADPRDADILDQLRLIPGAYARQRERALLRALCLREARRQKLPAGGDAAAPPGPWPDPGREPDAWERWIAANGLTPAGFARLAAEQALEARLAAMAEPLIERHLMDALRLSGLFPELAGRAARLRRAIGPAGAGEPGPAQLGVRPGELLARHAAARGEPPPRDAEAYARALGFPDAAALLRALARNLLAEVGEVPELSAIAKEKNL
jgi:hypothetical protein